MKKVLIVDDDKASLMMAQQALQEDYRVTMVKSGEQALMFLNNNTCDLILLDYEMPVMSGVQTLEKIRSNPKTKDLPVIFLTGNDDTRDIYSALALKPNGYILKPVDPSELRFRVARIFE